VSGFGPHDVSAAATPIIIRTGAIAPLSIPELFHYFPSPLKTLHDERPGFLLRWARDPGPPPGR